MSRTFAVDPMSFVVPKIVTNDVVSVAINNNPVVQEIDNDNDGTNLTVETHKSDNEVVSKTQLTAALSLDMHRVRVF
jgi:hypothetical protein